MKYPMLDTARLTAAAVVVCGAVALGVGRPALGDPLVTEEQAEAAAVAAREADAEGQMSVNEPVVASVETVVWRESADEKFDWFPSLEENVLTLLRSPVETSNLPIGGLADDDDNAISSQWPTGNIIANEQTVIPLPPAAWTGLAGLMSLATIRGRKAIVRFFFT